MSEVPDLPTKLGQVAYQGYAASSNGVSLISGEILPPWIELPKSIRDAWDASAETVIEYCKRAYGGL